jgi:uncharacterized membrane protein
MLVNIFVVLVGFYCVLESISAAADMHKGDRFCHLAKYLLAGASGLYVISVVVHASASVGILILITAVALGLWPRMVYRITGGRRSADHLKGRVGG